MVFVHHILKIKEGCILKRANEFVKSAYSRGRRLADALSRDRITVYAAQASFFAIISAMPFLSLLLSAVSLFIPPDALSLLDGYSFSEEVMDVLGSIVLELQALPKIPLLSVSVVFALWSASRGVSAVHMGLERIYEADSGRGFFLRRLISLLGILLFIGVFIALSALLMFGDYIGKALNLGRVTDGILALRVPFMLSFLTVALAVVYSFAARGSSAVSSSFRAHLIGAAFAAAGWVAFSKGYGLYLRFFPRASYVYGSIGAVCLLMLWVYFCMIILFVGAEVNKWRRKL